jgi:hypothetical protein
MLSSRSAEASLLGSKGSSIATLREPRTESLLSYPSTSHHSLLADLPVTQRELLKSRNVRSLSCKLQQPNAAVRQIVPIWAPRKAQISRRVHVPALALDGRGSALVPGSSNRRWLGGSRRVQRLVTSCTADWDAGTVSLDSQADLYASDERTAAVEIGTESERASTLNGSGRNGSAAGGTEERTGEETSTSGRSDEAPSDGASGAEKAPKLGQKIQRLFAFLRSVGPGGEWWNIEGSKVPLNTSENGRVFRRVFGLVAERPVTPLFALVFLVLASVSMSGGKNRNDLPFLLAFHSVSHNR